MAKGAKPRRIRAGRMEHHPRGRKNKTSLIKSNKKTPFSGSFFIGCASARSFCPLAGFRLFSFPKRLPSFAAHGRFALLYPPFHVSSVFSHIASFPPASFSHVLSRPLLSRAFFPGRLYFARLFLQPLSRTISFSGRGRLFEISACISERIML